ncbi:hypothetical protein [Kitasatospora sp. NPDC098663]|uniref:hypothetical protein n=1 Tax=Kitasatospora sp. NPDC098663 TaxID=3364096 RepID=UPI00381ED98E
MTGLAKFVDEHVPSLGLAPEEVRLDSEAVDLVQVMYAWEASMRQEYGLESPVPYSRTTAVLALVGNRAAVDAAVSEDLRLRAQAPAAYRRPPIEPLDEYDNAERIALRDAARAGLRALEERLARGRELLAAGVDPREGGWNEPANLVWAARARLLNSQVLEENLPHALKWWPQPVRDLMPTKSPDGRPVLPPGVRSLSSEVAQLLFPDDMDLHPFRVLLLLAMTDTTPEELNDLHLDDVEFVDGGVRVVQQKNRANRVRADLHPETEESVEPAPEAEEGTLFTGAGTWDVPGLFRRLMAATALTREAFPEADPWLFLAVIRDQKGTGFTAEVSSFARQGCRFTHWIGGQSDAEGRPLKISEPHDVRRLRKTAKVVRATVLGGTVSDLAGDDHHVEVYRGHYAHGTTAHVLAGHAINQAQQWVFGRTVQAPVIVTEEAEAHLEDPEVAADLGLDAAQAKAMLSGEQRPTLLRFPRPGRVGRRPLRPRRASRDQRQSAGSAARYRRGPRQSREQGRAGRSADWPAR